MDTEITGNSGSSGYETQIYNFYGTVGQRIFVDHSTSATSGYYFIYDAAGQLTSSKRFNNSHEYIELPTTDNYTLVVAGEGSVNNDYTINLVSSEVTVADYIIGNTVTAQITEPGSENVYTFKGTLNQQLWFDRLDTSSINAALYAPSGNEVWSQSSDSDQAITNLEETGTYRLVLDGSYEATGAYSFRMLDLADVSSIDLDTVVSGDFGDSTEETQIYRFTASQGQPLYLDRTVGNTNNYYSIYDINGTKISDEKFDQDLELDNLPQDGEYYLVLEGRGSDGNNNNYSLEIVTPQITTTPYNLGETIETEISEAGEKDYYTFSATKGQTLLFDSLGTASSTTFDLFAPSGRKVLNGSLNNIDYWDNLDETGTFTLVIDGSGDTTDSYSFRLADYQEIATGIELDTTITGNLGASQRETDVYAFEGDEGQYLYFDRTVGDDDYYWRLYDEQNNLINFKELLTDDFELALPHTGQYTLHLSGYRDSNNNYSFQIVTPELNTATYTIGETVVSNIGEVGEKDYYTFEGKSEQKLLFDSLSSITNVNWQLNSPSGIQVFESDSIESDLILTLSETGTYTLTIDGIDDASNSYGFRLQNWSKATTIDLNTTISGDFGEGRETDIYQFTAIKDSRLFFDRTVGDYNDFWAVYDSQGLLLSENNNRLSSDFELTVSSTDNYTLYLNGSTNNNNDYSFDIITSELITSTLSLNEEISGTIDFVGEEDIYIFDGSIGQKLFFDSLEKNTNISAKLYSPTNNIIHDNNLDEDSTLLTLTENGSYRLVIDGDNSTTGDYRFNLKDIDQVDLLELETPLTVSLNNRNEVKLYQFNGTKGTVLDLKLDRKSLVGTRWELYDPGDNLISNINHITDKLQPALVADGIYTLVVSNIYADSINYTFEVANITPSTITNTGFNNVYAGNLAPGEVIDHNFSANAGTQIFLDSLSPIKNEVLMRLVAPDGSAVFNSTGIFPLSDKESTTLPQAGEYSLQVYGRNTSSTGNYSFQLLELPQDLTNTATESLILGSIHSDTVNGLESKIYSFDAKVGQQILFNGISGSNVKANLIAPNGTSIFSQESYGTTNKGIHTLNQKGIYHLVISGEATTIVQDYDFQLLDLNFTESIKFNQTTSGSLPDGRANKIYSFSGKAGEIIGLDFLSGSTSIKAKLYAPGNHQILKETTVAFDSDYTLELPKDGTYTLLIEGGTDAATIDYSFRTYIITKPQDNIIIPGTGENDGNDDGSLAVLPVKLAATDGLGGVGIQEYSIRLKSDPDNANPVIISTPPTQYSINQKAYRYQIDAIEPDNDALTYSLVSSPTGTIIDSETGELLWFPETVVVGNSYEFTVEVADGRGGVDTQTFTVEVSQPSGTIQGIVFEDLNANGIPDSNLLKGDQPDIFFVIDVSGSMGGSYVDWLTADIDEISNQNISPLDQELAAIVALAEFTVAQGRGGESQFGIIDSSGGVTDMNPFEPGIQESILANADFNNNGILDVREAITGGIGSGGSGTDGIQTAWDLHKALPGDPNIVFMSDGFIFVDQQLIANAKADGVNITAFGFAEGGMETMRLVDPDAIYIQSPQEIVNIFSGFDPRFVGEPIMDGVTVYLDLNDNGSLDEDEPSQINRQDNSISRLGKNNYSFSFDNLLPGTYTLRQIVPNGFTQTAPETDSFLDTVTVAGETFIHFFGNHKAEPIPNSNPIFTSLAPIDGLEVGNLFRYEATATDIDANFLSYELTLAPEGMNVDSETGTVLWQPSENQTGTAKAILRVNDGEGGTDIQYFELSVTEPNTPPVFTSSLEDNISPQVGKPFQYQAVAVDADLDPVTYELTGSNPNGVTIDPDTGLVSWTPASQYLGERTITIKAIDESGSEAIQTLELNVIEAQPNRAPDITSTPRNNVRIGTNYFYQPIASDPDSNPLSFSLLSAPEGMVMDDAGRVIWSPSGSQFGVHSVEIEVTDGQGGQAVQSFEIIASDRASNSLPSIISVPDTRTNSSKLYTYQATATDPDGDLLLWVLDKAPEGMVIDQNTGSISWQPGADQVGTHTVAVKVVDALGAFVGQEFTLTVTGVNTPASIVSTPITNGSANQLYTYQVTGTDAENDSLTYGLGVRPEGMTIDPDTGVINWTPSVGGSYDVEVLIFDTQGGTNKQVFTLEIESETINSEPTITTTPTIVEGNTAPTIISAPKSDGAVNQPYTYQVNATDAENDTLTYGFTSRPESMSIDSDTGEITWTPAVGGNYDIEVLVFDEHGARTSQEFTVDVEALPPNTAPTITSSPSYAGDVDTAYNYQVAGEDPEGDILNYELIAAPDGMTIDSATGSVTWANPVLGQHQVVVGVRDGKAGVAQGYILTVKQNQAPIVNFSSPPAPTAIPGETYSYDVPAFDPNGDRLTFTIDSVSLDKGFTIDELGRLRWTPEASDAGNHPVIITIRDEAGAEIEQSFTLEVVADTEAPKIDLYPGDIFVVDGEYQTDINSTVTFQAWATDNIGVTGVQLLVNGVPVAVDRDGVADITFDELGTVEIGAYALDAAGNIGEATATVDVYDFSDVDAPSVSIDLSGIEDNIVTAPVDIIGTITDDNLDYYVLEIGAADGEGEFVELYRGTTPFTDDVIATFDPSTVANDAYFLGRQPSEKPFENEPYKLRG